MNLNDNVKNNNQSIEAFWNNCHLKLCNNYQVWLTGSKGPEVWNILNIIDKIKPKINVLNIGVGLGYCTKELVRRKCNVHVLDISKHALDKVRDIAKTYLPTELQDMPQNYFDLIISNLVAQHMSHNELSTHIKYLLKTMKPTGVFAMQFAFSTIPENNNIEPSLPDMKSGGVCRTLSFVSGIVEKGGGYILYTNRIGLFPEYQSGWYAIHIARRDYPYISSIRNKDLSVYEKIRLKLHVFK